VPCDNYQGEPKKSKEKFNEVSYNNMKIILNELKTRNDFYYEMCNKALLALPRIYNKPDMQP
jgi:hypothetical protein